MNAAAPLEGVCRTRYLIRMGYLPPPSKADSAGFSMPVKPELAAATPCGWVSTSAMMTPTMTRAVMLAIRATLCPS